MRTAILMLAASLLSPAARAACEASTERPLPLLELYTSEGCSSCPPADRWMSGLVRAAAAIEAVPLAFHVPYWDYIGWKDRFAAPAHEARQRARVAATGKRVVYTPQVMLGDDVQVDWSDRAEVAAAASAAHAAAPPLKLSLRATPNAKGYDVAVAAAGEGEWQVQLALYSNGLHSRITAGENRTLELHHDRVVRRLHRPRDASGGRVESIVVPKEPGSALGVVAIATRRGVPGTGWALDLPLEACKAEPGT
jgi:hypothetical protein